MTNQEFIKKKYSPDMAKKIMDNTEKLNIRGYLSAKINPSELPSERLFALFVWSDSPEGNKYWCDFHTSLQKQGK